MIQFFVPGEPVAKERPRTVNGHTYTPQKTLDHEAKIQQVWNLVSRKWDKVGRFDVEVTFFVGRDNKDLDNMLKTVLDALNKLAWTDDLKVQRIVASKHKQKPGGTAIHIRRIEE